MNVSRLVAVVAVAWASVAITTPAAAKLHLRKPARGFQLRMESFEVVPGQDREGCEHMVTPNRKPMDVGAFELKTTPGTHHFVVWEYLGGDHNPADFWNGIGYATACSGLGPRDGFLNTADLFGMLTSNVRFQFPRGVAVRLEPHADIYANLHYHDYLATPVTTDAVFNFIPARKGTVKHHARSLLVGSFQIDIPPQGSASLTGEWHTPVDLNVVQLSTHQHHRGTLVSAHEVDAAGNDMGELVSSPDWQHPTVRWWSPALRLPAGAGIRFTCDWQNPDDHAVHFGVTTEDEMCFVPGYFYPDDDTAPPPVPGCLPQGSGFECFVPKR
jgi:hypothetical protein